MRLRKLPSIRNVEQTKAEFCFQPNLARHIGERSEDCHNQVCLHFLRSVEKNRARMLRMERLDKMLEVDCAHRDAYVLQMWRSNEEITPQSRSMIKNGLRQFEKFYALENREKIASASPLVTVEIAHKKGETSVLGLASAVIRASPQQIIAYQFDVLARHLQDDHIIDKSIIEATNRQQLVRMVEVLPMPFHKREFLMRFLWHKLDDEGGNYAIHINPEAHDLYPESTAVNEGSIRGSIRGSVASAKDYLLRSSQGSAVGDRLVRAHYSSTIKLAKLRLSETKVDCWVHLDMKGRDHTGSLVNIRNLHIRNSLNRVVEMQTYFQKLLPLNNLDARDGEALGVAFNVQRSIERKKERSIRRLLEGKHVKRCVAIVVGQNKGLRKMSELHTFFSSLMEGILNNHLMMSEPAVNSKIINLSSKEANTIGRKLSKILKSKPTPETAIDQWRLQNPAILELDKRYAFFIPMCITIGTQKVIEAPWVSTSSTCCLR